MRKYENAFEIQPKLLKLARARIEEHKRDARARNILKDYVTKLVTINCLNPGVGQVVLAWDLGVYFQIQFFLPITTGVTSSYA